MSVGVLAQNRPYLAGIGGFELEDNLPRASLLFSFMKARAGSLSAMTADGSWAVPCLGLVFTSQVLHQQYEKSRRQQF